MDKYIIELPEEAEAKLNNLITEYGGFINKRPYSPGLGNHCRDCVYLDHNDKSTVGYGCNRPNHFWKHNSTRYKQKCAPACSAFIKREDADGKM